MSFKKQGLFYVGCFEHKQMPFFWLPILRTVYPASGLRWP